jgi:hypothetical protein
MEVSTGKGVGIRITITIALAMAVVAGVKVLQPKNENGLTTQVTLEVPVDHHGT